MAEGMIVQLRQQITSEQEAARQGVYGLACVAAHRSITARMEQAWQRLQALQEAGMEQEARALLTSDTFYEPCEEASCKNRSSFL